MTILKFKYCSYICEQLIKFDMAKKKYTQQEEQLARFAKALGHPARIVILKFLAAQENCFFGDLHEVLPIAKATVSQQIGRAHV